VGIISVTHQGAPIVHTDSVIEKVCGDIATLTIDMESKYCQVVAYSVSKDGYPVIIIGTTKMSSQILEGANRTAGTDVELGEYKGWGIFLADISRYTLRVCLVKGDDHEEDQEHNDV